jgi:transcriptional antiterminator RfaH
MHSEDRFLDTDATTPCVGESGLGLPSPIVVGSALESSKRWFVVHTQPKSEMRAVANLERQEFRTFCPAVRRTIRHARKSTVVMTALFPNYVFVELDRLVDSWRAINGTRGVVRLLTNGDEPLPVPPGIIEDLKRRMGGDGALDWTASLKIGERVTISEGPFAKFIGTLEHLDATGRVQVLLDLLGRSVRVSVKNEAISPVN